MSKAADTGSSLSYSDFKLFEIYSEYGGSPSTNDEIVLIAPNKRIKKLWEKEYRGIKVILEADHKGYPAPTQPTGKERLSNAV